MNELINETRVILIGGASHTEKSTLAQALAQQFGWNYRSIIMNCLSKLFF